jgi:hypothetical protein
MCDRGDKQMRRIERKTRGRKGKEESNERYKKGWNVPLN